MPFFYCLSEKYVFAVGTDRNGLDGGVYGFLYLAEVAKGVFRQLVERGSALQLTLPAGVFVQYGLYLHRVELEGYLLGLFSSDDVFVAHLDGLEVVENVDFGDQQVGDAVKHAGVFQCGDVDPAAAARTACGGAELVAFVAQNVAVVVEQFCGEGTATHTSAVGFGDAEHLVNLRGSHAQSGANAGGDGG